jgi:hypothetical protein
MSSRKTIGLLALVGLVSILAIGCGKKDEKLDTQAPPPSNGAAAAPEVSPNKAQPGAPPSIGNPPQSK